MQINGCSIPDEVIKALGRKYKDAIVAAGTAAGPLGQHREDPTYIVALSLVTGMAETIRVAYGFESLKAAHNFLRAISANT